MYDIILFDLDGTLSDSGPGIMRSVRYALAKFGITEESEEKLRRFVGPPMIESYQRFCGFSHEQAVQALAYYREDYLSGAIYMNTPYEGMESHCRVTHTFVNGNLVFENGVFHEENKGERLEFNR